MRSSATVGKAEELPQLQAVLSYASSSPKNLNTESGPVTLFDKPGYVSIPFSNEILRPIQVKEHVY